MMYKIKRKNENRTKNEEKYRFKLERACNKVKTNAKKA